MKINVTNILTHTITRRITLMLSAGIILASCSAQMGSYSETDGVYYDPEKDVLPENTRYNSRVGEVYPFEDEENHSIADGAFERKWEKNNKYWNDNSGATHSDWGNYTGSETHIYDNRWIGYGGWGWYNPYRWGWGYPYGMYGGYYGGYGWNWGLHLGFGWGWNSYYHPYWDFYNPYWGYGYGMWGGYGWGLPYHGYRYRSIPRARSGAVNSFRNGGYSNYGTQRNSNTFGNQRHSGFTQPNQSRGFQQNSGFRSNANTRFQDNSNYGPRSGSYNNPPRRSNFNHSTPRQSGFNNATPRSGGFNNSSSGGFRSGGFNSGGGVRSGSGRVGGFR